MLTSHDTYRATNMLREIADCAANDIERDHADLDVEYDMYVEQVDGFELVGVVDMGEAWQGAFEWDAIEGKWYEAMHLDPSQVRDRIIEARMSGRRIA